MKSVGALLVICAALSATTFAQEDVLALFPQKYAFL